MSIRCPRLPYLCFGLLALANAGCLAVAAGTAVGAGAAGYAYHKGKICQAYLASFDDSWAAARLSLTELGMPILAEERQTTVNGFLKSQTSDGTPVRVYLTTEPSPIPAEGTLTRVCVRVATFGDPTLSERVLVQVDSHLKPSRAAPPLAPVAQPAQPWTPVNAPAAGPRPAPTPPPPLLAPEPVTKQ